jgi:hypothetical protein
MPPVPLELDEEAPPVPLEVEDVVVLLELLAVLLLLAEVEEEDELVVSVPVEVEPPVPVPPPEPQPNAPAKPTSKKGEARRERAITNLHGTAARGGAAEHFSLEEPSNPAPGAIPVRAPDPCRSRRGRKSPATNISDRPRREKPEMHPDPTRAPGPDPRAPRPVREQAPP